MHGTSLVPRPFEKVGALERPGNEASMVHTVHVYMDKDMTVCVYLGSHKPVSGAHGSGQNMEHTQGQFEEGALKVASA